MMSWQIPKIRRLNHFFNNIRNMDKELKKNIWLGFFVVLGIVVFVIGIFQIGSRKGLFGKSFTISTVFDNAAGLKPGAVVRFNGVKVGIVDAVNLINDSVVQVDMNIDENKRKFITKSAVADIASDGLMGDKLINITTETAGGNLVDNNDFIRGKKSINTEQAMQTLMSSNENVRVITDNLKTLTNDINSETGTIQALYKDPAMAQDLKQSLKNLKGASSEVLQLSKTLKQVTVQMQSGKGALGTMISDTNMANNLTGTISQMKATSDQLTKVSEQLSVTMKHINSGNGAFNQLLTDTALSTDIRQSVNNIKNAADGLNQNMEALKHSFLLRGYFKKQQKKKEK